MNVRESPQDAYFAWENSIIGFIKAVHQCKLRKLTHWRMRGSF